MSPLPTVHAGAVLVGETGVLVRGASGSGKSSLILSLLTVRPKASWLVADDRVVLAEAHGRLVASVPVAIAGLIEIRGQGIVARPFVSPVVIGLVVDIVPPDAAARMPEPEEAVATVLAVRLPRLALPAGIVDPATRVLAAVAETSAKPRKPAAFKASCVAESIRQDTAFGAAGGTGRDGCQGGAVVRRDIGRRSGA